MRGANPLRRSQPSIMCSDTAKVQLFRPGIDSRGELKTARPVGQMRRRSWRDATIVNAEFAHFSPTRNNPADMEGTDHNFIFCLTEDLKIDRSSNLCQNYARHLSSFPFLILLLVGVLLPRQHDICLTNQFHLHFTFKPVCVMVQYDMPVHIQFRLEMVP